MYLTRKNILLVKYTLCLLFCSIAINNQSVFSNEEKPKIIFISNSPLHFEKYANLKFVADLKQVVSVERSWKMNMGHIVLVEPGHKIREQDLSRFEKKFNIRLPEDYKDFLLDFSNGGFPSKGEIRFTVNTIDEFHELGEYYGGVGYFYPLEKLSPGYYPDNAMDENEIETGDYDEELYKNKAKKYLVIAKNYEDRILIGIEDENFGEVFLWTRYTWEKYNPFKISDSFGAFIEMIEFVPEQNKGN